MKGGWKHNRFNYETEVTGYAETDLLKSARNDISSLVIREYIQNSLDAKRDEDENTPVVIKIYFTDNSGSADKYFGELKEHIAMPLFSRNMEEGTDIENAQWDDMLRAIRRYMNEGRNNKLKYPDKGRSLLPIKNLFELNQRCMIFEDYNTVGLTGSISADLGKKESTKTRSRFKLFIYNTDVTGAGGGAPGGSHGSGRKCLFYASCIQSFLVYTRRAEDPEEVVSGMSFTLPREPIEVEIGEKPYSSVSRFGEFNEYSESKEMSGCTDLRIVKDVKETFGLRRIGQMPGQQYVTETKDTGLSVIVPFPDVELSDENITLDILANYARTIFEGDLVVIQHFRNSKREESEYRVYDGASVIEHVKEIISKKEGEWSEVKRFSGEKREKRKKVDILKCLVELLERPNIHLDEPDVTLVGVKNNLVESFRKEINGKKKLGEKIKAKYENFELIHIHIKKLFQYNDDSKKERNGSYRLFLKRVNGEGHSLLMRGFTLYSSDKSIKKNEGFVSLSIALRKEDDKVNPYAEFLRKCETADHREAEKGKVGNTGVIDPKQHLNVFNDAYKIGAYLERVIQEKAEERIPDPLFGFPRDRRTDTSEGDKEQRERNIDGFSIVSSQGKGFTITATEALRKSRWTNTREKIEVHVDYIQDTGGGRSKNLRDDDLVPRFVIFLDQMKEDRIEKVDPLSNSSNGRVVYTYSSDFRIRGEIKDELDAEYEVYCKLIKEGEE